MNNNETLDQTCLRQGKRQQRYNLKRSRTITRAISKKITLPFKNNTTTIENHENLRTEQIPVPQKSDDIEQNPTSKEIFSQKQSTSILKNTNTQTISEIHIKSPNTSSIFAIIFLRILPSSLLFWFVSLILIFLQIEIHDFCF